MSIRNTLDKLNLRIRHLIGQIIVLGLWTTDLLQGGITWYALEFKSDLFGAWFMTFVLATPPAFAIGIVNGLIGNRMRPIGGIVAGVFIVILAVWSVSVSTLNVFLRDPFCQNNRCSSTFIDQIGGLVGVETILLFECGS